MTELGGQVPVGSNAERIVRTFLIADVRGYTAYTVAHGDEAAARLAARFADLTEEIVSAHEGQVVELRGDEALAAFASARQALRAAGALQDVFRRETLHDPASPMRVGIGLDAGEAIPVKDGYRGAALNMAARLCSLAAAGEVLTSDTVVNLARKLEGLSYSERGFAQLKGFADPVRVVQVEADTAMAPPTPGASDPHRLDPGAPSTRLPIGGFLGALPAGVLLGRDVELRRMEAVVDVVSGGTGQLVFLIGEPGVGKTRLAQELTLVLRDRGFVVAAGRCYEPHQSLAFFPFREALASLYAGASPDLRTAATRDWPYLARLLPGVADSAAPSDSPEAQARLFWSVSAFLCAVAERVPMALLLDDLHWADGASLDLLTHLARHTRASRVLLLGTYRDVEVGRHQVLERVLRDLHREGLALRLPVQRLERESTAALMAATLGEDEIPGELAALVHRYTDGNAFFTQEVIRALVDRGDVFRENGRWARRELRDIEVPESIRSTVGERLTHLGQAAQTALREASVLGQTFRFDDLQALGGHEEEELENALQQALHSGLIRDLGRDRYAFNHALTQHALYSELPSRRRRRMHEAAGAVLEQLPTAERLGRAAELAWHFLQADNAERALHWSLIAGDQAESVFAHGEAEGHYQTAQDLALQLTDGGREAEAAEKRGWASRNTGRYDEALELLERAAALYSGQGDAEAELRTVVRIGRTHWLRGTVVEGIERLQPLLTEHAEEGPSLGLAQLHMVHGYLCFPAGRYEEELTTSTRAADMARALSAHDVLAHAELMRGVALLMLGQPRAGLRVVEEGISAAESSNDIEALSHLTYNAGIIHRLMGDMKEARTATDRALDLAGRMGDPFMTGVALHGLGMIAFNLGEWDEARTQFERSAEIFRALDSWTLAYPLCQLGALSLAQGQWKEMSASLANAAAVAERGGDRQALRVIEELFAERDLLWGRPMEALARLEPFLDVPEWTEVDITALTPLFSLAAWAYLESERAIEAERFADRAVRAAGVAENKSAHLAALRVQGMVLARSGRHSAAEQALEEAIRTARGGPYPYAEARALYEHAVLLSAGSVEGGTSLDRARVGLETAHSMFERLGAAPYAERTSRALEELESGSSEEAR